MLKMLISLNLHKFFMAKQKKSKKNKSKDKSQNNKSEPVVNKPIANNEINTSSTKNQTSKKDSNRNHTKIWIALFIIIIILLILFLLWQQNNVQTGQDNSDINSEIEGSNNEEPLSSENTATQEQDDGMTTNPEETPVGEENNMSIEGSNTETEGSDLSNNSTENSSPDSDPNSNNGSVESDSVTHVSNGGEGRVDAPGVASTSDNNTATGHTKSGAEKTFGMQAMIQKTRVWEATDYKFGDIFGEQYTIQLGDTLWEIAEAKYGDGFRWTDIYNANKSKVGILPNGCLGLIFPGEVLVLK